MSSDTRELLAIALMIVGGTGLALALCVAVATLLVSGLSALV